MNLGATAAMWRLLQAWFHLRELEIVQYGHVRLDTNLGMPDQLTLNLCCTEQNHPCRGGSNGKISSLIHHNDDECHNSDDETVWLGFIENSFQSILFVLE